MKFPHFLAFALNTPWAMEPSAMHTYAAMLARTYARKSGVAADIGDSAAVSAMFAEILAKFGTLDILINNAALTPSDAESAKSRIEFMQMITTPIAKHSLKVTSQMSDERWLKMINTNLNGLFYCTREALRIMEPKGYGKIVNVGSVSGITAVRTGSPYGMSKAAITQLTRNLAIEWPPVASPLPPGMKPRRAFPASWARSCR